VFKVGMLLMVGSCSVSALRFARNILLARLVSAEDYGIASTFIIVTSFLSLAGDLALDHMIIQDRRGAGQRFVGVIQAVIMLRAVFMSTLMLLLAAPTAELFGLPGLAWVFSVIALIPLLQGIVHPDLFRHQRDSRFAPFIIAELAGVFVSLPVMVWLAFVLGDFRIMLVVLLVEQAVRALVSHVYAERPFPLGWDNAVALDAFRFGAPLVLSGLTLFAITQGERILVANLFTLRDLGIFSAAVTFAFTPGQLLAIIQQRYFLPQLAPAALASDTSGRRINEALQVTLLTGAGFALGAYAFGPRAMVVLFGERFAEGATFIGLIALVAALSAMRSGPNVVALSDGHTWEILAANVVRLVSLPIAVAIVVDGGSILDILIVGALGEAVALLFAYAFVVWRGKTVTRRTFVLLALTLALCAILGVGIVFEQTLSMPALLSAAVLFLASTAIWYAAPPAR